MGPFTTQASYQNTWKCSEVLSNQPKTVTHTMKKRQFINFFCQKRLTPFVQTVFFRFTVIQLHSIEADNRQNWSSVVHQDATHKYLTLYSI